MDNRSLYFQTIARKFFELRGAPFFLSSKELTQIEKWESAGIPLRVVLEGIQSSFLSRRQKHGGSKRKVLSLAFCEPYVREAYAMYKERVVGRSQKGKGRENKKKDIQTAVVQFLEGIPQETAWLSAPFGQLKGMLAGCSEEDLERAEDEIEALLVQKASPQDKEETRRAVAAEFPEAAREEFQRIYRIKLIKFMRDKYKIPHVAPYYY